MHLDRISSKLATASNDDRQCQCRTKDRNKAGDPPKVKPTTRTTVMDAEPADAGAKVTIQRHPTDMHTLSDDIGNRVIETLKQDPIGCVYFNPAVTVSCSSPSPGFIRIIRKEQSRWCRQASKTFPRKVRRSASSWVGGGQWINHKFARYLDRALSFTGVLFIDGQLVLPHNWPSLVKS